MPEPGKPAPVFRLEEVRGGLPREDLSAFLALYERNFPQADEREEPALWLHRIRERPAEPQPLTHLLLARSADGSIAGGVLFEHYRRSRCGLLTYLVVDERFRGHGLARQLVSEAGRLLQEEAAAAGATLAALFAETENPAEFPGLSEPLSPELRLWIFARMGARWLDIPYVQPALGKDRGRLSTLLLLAFPLDEQPPGPLDPAVVLHFLDEFYRGLGVAAPHSDPDFQRMRLALRVACPLRHLEEALPLYQKADASLRFRHCSVCLHLLEKPAPQRQRGRSAYYYCSQSSSMELDLLAQAFRDPPVCNTECLTSSAQLDIGIVLPRTLFYRTEGRSMALWDARQPEQGSQLVLPARLGLSRTTFTRSRRVLWHLALRPADGDCFTAHDIIRLVHLYDGRSERTQLAGSIRFRHAGRDFSVVELLEALTQARGTVVGGTVHIDHRDEADPASAESALDLLPRVALARRHDGGRDVAGADRPAPRSACAREASAAQQRMLLGLCGIVTGIFDFLEIGEQELLDTLSPTFADRDSFIRVHRSTLLAISQDDRPLAACEGSLGASPYLLLPHALLLHNESVVKDADLAVEEALAGLSGLRHESDRAALRAARSLPELEQVLHQAERNLSFFLPNIFNYFTERQLVDQGLQGRGILERRKSALAKLEDLRNNIASLWHLRRETGQMLIACLLVQIPIMQVSNPFAAEASLPGLLRFAALSGGAVALIIVLWRYGLRRRVKPHD